MPVLTPDDVLSVAHNTWKWRTIWEFLTIIRKYEDKNSNKPKISDYQKDKYFVFKTNLTDNISPSNMSEIRLSENDFVYCIFIDEKISKNIVKVPCLHEYVTEIKVGNEFKKSEHTFEINIEGVKHINDALLEISRCLLDANQISQDTFNIVNGID